MKRYAYTRPDGGVSILVPIMKAKKPGQTDEEFIAGVKARQIPADTSDVTEVEEAAIPKDRTFRDAFKLNAGRIEVDMPKARELHMGRIRAVRDAQFPPLDREYMKADEAGDAARKSEIAAQKQKLRDIPQTFDLTVAKTPDDLKALWPSELPLRAAR